MQDRKRFFAANHIAFLANARVIKAFRQHVPNGLIGPSFAYSPAYPASCAPSDMLAFENAEEFTNLWWLDAYCFGRYPQAALAYLRETGEVPEILPGGDHVIAIGEVTALDADPAGRPLVWWRGEFGGLHYGA